MGMLRCHSISHALKRLVCTVKSLNNNNKKKIYFCPGMLYLFLPWAEFLWSQKYLEQCLESIIALTLTNFRPTALNSFFLFYVTGLLSPG